MIKLSDYLDYLYKEVIQARTSVDRQSVELAKKYAEHEYLKYFRVPRFTIPKVQLDIPIKINELDAETKYNFEMDEATYIADVNKRIKEVNKQKSLKIKPINSKKLRDHNFVEVTKELEKRDHRYVKRIDESIHKIDFSKKLNRFVSDFSAADERNDIHQIELHAILKDSLRNHFTPVSAKLNNVFIDPDTTKESDKDKILVNLHVEMVEEGLRIVKLKNEDGSEFEEIVFE